MNIKVHSQGNVPFSWENRPGISKVSHQDHDQCPTETLPPPPCSLSTDGLRIVGQHDLHIPLPPCPFIQPPTLRSSSRKGLKRHDDPFLAAYRECTKSVKQGNYKLMPVEKKKVSAVKDGRRRSSSSSNGFFSFSCKQSCGVREEGLVRMSSQLSATQSLAAKWKDGGLD